MRTGQRAVSAAIVAVMLMIGVVLTTSQAQAVPLTQEWLETNASPFDRIELYMLGDAANAFDPATTHINGNPDWGFQLVNPDFISMTGPAATQLYFTTGFADPATEFTLFTVDFAAFNGDVLVEAARLNWNGGWDIFPMTLAYDRSAYDTSASAPPVPEPGTMVLLGFGLATLAVLNKRRKSALVLS